MATLHALQRVDFSGGGQFISYLASATSSGVASVAPAPSFAPPSGCGTTIGAMITGITPAFRIPSCSATLGVTSTIRPSVYGPRSATLMVAVMPVCKLVTFAVVPRGKLLLAATLEFG